ncbi:MAG: Hpt domain-containing protein [Lewinella sp.]|jgi:HPt (histidine-containing phosphotransfer) domain-containing protein|uniref:Hpt domain-containing protein n=1 Tax=Lewinella sp. TaxID=2004506 RepID=UPI003D6A4E72
MIDKNAIALYFDDDHELFKRFVARFVEQTPALMNAIKRDISAGKLSQAGTDIHALKGHLRYLGLDKLSKQLEALESLAVPQGNKDVLLAGWQKFDRSFVPAFRFLKAY